MKNSEPDYLNWSFRSNNEVCECECGCACLWANWSRNKVVLSCGVYTLSTRARTAHENSSLNYTGFKFAIRSYVTSEGMQSKLTASLVFLIRLPALPFPAYSEQISCLGKRCGESVWASPSLRATAGGTLVFVCLYFFLKYFLTSPGLWCHQTYTGAVLLVLLFFPLPKRCPKSLHPKTKILAGSRNFMQLCNS